MRDIVKRRIFDALTAMRLGARLPESRLLLAGLPSRLAVASSAECELIRVLVAITRATEVDDIDISACVTAGAVVVPVALSLAPVTSGDEDLMLAAIVAGYEAMIRFGRAIDGPNILYQGRWPTYLAAPVGAAAVVATLGRRDARATAQALSLALTRTASSLHPSAPRCWQLGCAAAEGVAAARAAEMGCAVAPDVLARWARAAALDLHMDEPPSNASYGISGVDIKTFPTCRQALAAIDALRRLLVEAPMQSLAQIEVRVPAAYRDMIASPLFPRDRLESLLNVSYQMALLAVAPERLYDVTRATLADEPDIRHLMAKTTVISDADLSRYFPSRWGARVRLVRPDASSRECEVLSPYGSAADSPLSWKELTSKAANLARGSGIDPASFESLAAALQIDEYPRRDALLAWTCGR